MKCYSPTVLLSTNSKPFKPGQPPERRAMLNRILLGAVMSWAFSTTLAILFAASVSGRFSFSTLRLPGVIPVMLMVSTAVSLAITPIAIWAVRTGAKNLRIFGPLLWLLLAVYLVVVAPSASRYGLYGSVLLAAIGLVVLGFIPARK